jgi:hypothetical protein
MSTTDALDLEIQAIAARVTPDQLEQAAANLESFKEGSTPMMRVTPLVMVAFDLPPQES